MTPGRRLACYLHGLHSKNQLPKRGGSDAGATLYKITVPTCGVIRHNYSVSNMTLGLISALPQGRKDTESPQGYPWDERRCRKPELGTRVSMT